MLSAAIFTVGSLDFDARSGELRTRGGARRLEPKAAGVLRALCEDPGAVVSRQELLDRCWGPGEGSDEALTQAVAQIRRALDELGEPAEAIQTLAKRGYRLNAATEATAAAAGGGNHAPRVRSRGPVVLTVLLIALVVLWVAFPHELRHAVRHSLGLGPQAQVAKH